MPQGEVIAIEIGQPRSGVLRGNYPKVSQRREPRPLKYDT